MNPKQLTRDADKVNATLEEVGDQLITTKGCKIYIPTRYAEKGLINVGDDTYITMLYAMVVDDRYYAVSLVPAKGRIEPDVTNTVSMLGDEYFEFIFEPGSVVIGNLNLVQDKNITFDIHEELIGRGKIPWYLDYDDVGKLFDEAPKHAGVKVGANHAILEMIASTVARYEEDPTQFYRQIKDKVNVKPFYVPFKSVSYGASNTTAKLMGAYWNEGLTSALVNPTDNVEAIEELLRR